MLQSWRLRPELSGQAAHGVSDPCGRRKQPGAEDPGPVGIMAVPHQFGPGDDLVLESIGLSIPMTLLYRGVDIGGSASA